MRACAHLCWSCCSIHPPLYLLFITSSSPLNCRCAVALCYAHGCVCNFPREIYANKITNKFNNFMCKPCRQRRIRQSVSVLLIQSFNHSFVHSFISFHCNFTLPAREWLCLFVALSLSGLFALQLRVRVCAEGRHKSKHKLRLPRGLGRDPSDSEHFVGLSRQGDLGA